MVQFVEASKVFQYHMKLITLKGCRILPQTANTFLHVLVVSSILYVPT